MAHPVLRKVIDYGLLAAAIVLLVTAFEWYTARGREKSAEAYVKEMEKSARRQHPWQLPGVALRIEATATAEQYLGQDRTNGLRFERAGAVFLSSYIPLAEALPEICAKNGAAIPTFQRVFADIHQDALARARTRVEGTPLAEAKLRSDYLAKWREGTEKSLRELAIANDSTVAAECGLIESRGAEIAAAESLAGVLPVTYAILYE
jgi:hypothetical protein